MPTSPEFFYKTRYFRIFFIKWLIAVFVLYLLVAILTYSNSFDDRGTRFWFIWFVLPISTAVVAMEAIRLVDDRSFGKIAYGIATAGISILINMALVYFIGVGEMITLFL